MNPVYNGRHLIPLINPTMTIKEFEEQRTCYPPREMPVWDQGYKGWTPLGASAYQGNLPLIQHLYEQKPMDLNYSNYAGWTPLFSAVYNNQFSAAKALLDLGANPNQLTTQRYADRIRKETTDGGISPLKMACKRGEKGIATLLLRKGAQLGENEKLTDQEETCLQESQDGKGDLGELGYLIGQKNEEFNQLNDLPLDLSNLIYSYVGRDTETKICPDRVVSTFSTILLGMTVISAGLSLIPPLRLAGSIALRGIALLSATTCQEEPGTERALAKIGRVAAIALGIIALSASLPILMTASIGVDLGMQLWESIRFYSEGQWRQGSIHLLWTMIDALALAGSITGLWQCMVASMALATAASMVSFLFFTQEKHWRSLFSSVALSGLFGLNMLNAILTPVGITGFAIVDENNRIARDENGAIIHGEPFLSPSDFPMLSVGGAPFHALLESPRDADEIAEGFPLPQ